MPEPSVLKTTETFGVPTVILLKIMTTFVKVGKSSPLKQIFERKPKLSDRYSRNITRNIENVY